MSQDYPAVLLLDDGRQVWHRKTCLCGNRYDFARALDGSIYYKPFQCSNCLRVCFVPPVGDIPDFRPEYSPRWLLL